MVRARSTVAAIFVCGYCAALAHAGIIFVDDDALPGGNGTSWNTAFQSVYAALAIAQNNDDIRIAQGTYAAINGSFDVNRPLTIQGGFAGLTGPGDPDTYDPALFRTILTGDLQGNDGPNFANQSDNVDIVVSALAASNLIGLRIESGTFAGLYAANALNAVDLTFRWNYTGSYGGANWTRCSFEDNRIGLLTGAIGIQLAECSFRRCTVRAIDSSGSLPKLFTDCSFEENGRTTLDIGNGAVTCSSQATFTRCTFVGNHNASSGGAIAFTGSALSVRDSEFEQNASSGVGGAISADGFLIENCNFTANVARVGGGVSGNGTITSCIFIDNLAAEPLAARGGAVSGNVIATNSLFVRNTTSGDGGAVAGEGAYVNCTFFDNLAVFFGGAVHAWSGTSALRNCIAWSNTAALGSQLSIADAATLRVAFSTIEGGTSGALADGDGELLWGLGNRSANPLFVNVATDDYRLTAGSPCIDAAENFVVTSQLDLAGLARFVDAPGTPDTGLGEAPIVDMGAYEFQATDPTPSCDGDVNNDRVVDIQDLAVLLSNFGTTGGATLAQGDLNGDQDVDISDLALLLSYFGSTCD